jgi:hypothetical protein
MDDLNDIKQVWLSADVNALPKAGEVLKIIRTYRLKQAVKTIVFLLFVLVLFFGMIWVLFKYKSQFLTTRIGEACMMAAIFMLLSIGFGELKKVASSKNFDNDKFLDYLKKEQIRMAAFQRKTQVIGFALACVGLSLYVFEEASKSLLLMAGFYSFLAVYFVVVWFVFRPRMIKRSGDKLNKTIEKLEKLSFQFKQ